MFRTIRLRKTILCLLTVIFALAFSLSASAEKAQLGRVMKADVNLRAQPSQDSEAIQKVEIGEEVEILRQQDDWYYVMYKGKPGYIRSDLLFIASLEKRVCFANEDDVNLRGGPGTSSYIVAKVLAGRPMHIISVVGEWYFVKYQGITGFVHRSLVSVANQTGLGNSVLLRMGMEGMEVKRLQQELANRNFLAKQYVTGVYGQLTVQAVKDFQKAANLPVVDGVAGADTIKLLYDASNKTRRLDSLPMTKQYFYGRVQLIDWWKGGSNVLKRPGGVATIYDVGTGKTFRIIRTGGTNHNDIAPLTAKDTAILKSCYGGAWSWNRRAILVITQGGAIYAASMNGMPHGHDTNKLDGVTGMFCIHFVNSRTHGGNRVDPDHQRMIMYAYNLFKKK